MFNKTIKQLHEELKSGKITVQDLYNYSLNNINESNQEINSLISVFNEKDVSSIELNNVLSGIPYSLKDNINVKGHLTTAASKLLKDNISTYNATIFDLLEDKGAVLVGKDNLDEFANGISTKTSYYNRALNPKYPDYLVGGSSGGSAASVAANYAMFSIGTDTGGSVRLPAAWTGLVGFKPSYGRISRYGVISFSSSLDTPGVIAKCVEDVSVVYDNLVAKDNKDATNIGDDTKTFDKLNQDISNIKVATLKGLDHLNVDKSLKDGVNKVLEILGKEKNDKEIKHLDYLGQIYYAIACVELYSNLNRYDGIRYGKNSNGLNWIDTIKETRKMFSTEVKKRVIVGASLVSTDENKEIFEKTKKMRRELIDSVDQILEENDVLIIPTTASTAPHVEEEISPELLMLTDQFTIISSMSGTPAISINVGYDENNLPVGIQLISKAYSEAKLLNIAYQIEKKLKESN